MNNTNKTQTKEQIANSLKQCQLKTIDNKHYLISNNNQKEISDKVYQALKRVVKSEIEKTTIQDILKQDKTFANRQSLQASYSSNSIAPYNKNIITTRSEVIESTQEKVNVIVSIDIVGKEWKTLFDNEIIENTTNN